MKIFFGVDFGATKISIRIENDIGDFIVLQGKDCRDFMPFYGAELDEGEQAKLTKWLSEHDCN